MDRRKFFASAALGASGVMLGKTVMAAGTEPGNSPVIYRTLGRTGIKVPVVSMGVMRADNPNLVKAALEKGILHFDTAHGYQRGNNEKMLGELFREYPRDSFVIATKVKPTGVDRETGNYTKETDPEEFMKNFETSLERLQMDYVDILYVHDISSVEALKHKGILKTVKKIKKEGRARFIGFSTHRNMPAVIEAAAKAGVYDVVLTSYNFQMTDYLEMNAAIEKAAAAGMGVIAMKTMAGGFFDRERTKPVNTKAALKWALQNPNIHTSIPGFTSFDQLEESFAVMEDISLSDTELKDLNLAAAADSMYCLGCNLCAGQCVRGLPVPDLLRAYMYTYGYRAYHEARELVASLNLAENPCTGCAECTVQCVKAHPVAERIADVSRWKGIPADFFVA